MKNNLVLKIICAILVLTIVVLGIIFIYNGFKGREVNIVETIEPTITTETTIKTTETISIITTSSVEQPTTTESTLSAEELQSQIDENNRRLESLQAESESLRLESESIEASISESIVESSIQESIWIEESIKASKEAEMTTTTKETTKKQTTEHAETTKAPTEDTKPKGEPKLSKSSITISVGDTDSFISQASEIYVKNTNVGASLDFSGVNFYTAGTYTAYFNALDGSYSLPLTVVVQ